MLDIDVLNYVIGILFYKFRMGKEIIISYICISYFYEILEKILDNKKRVYSCNEIMLFF